MPFPTIAYNVAVFSIFHLACQFEMPACRFPHMAAREKGHESRERGGGFLLLWYNEFDNESDTASSLDLAV